MDIQEALKETGEAEDVSNSTNYVKWNSDEIWWYDKKTNNARRALHHCEMFNNYQPYHEEKKIIPEYMGELWQYEDECGEGKQTLVTIFKWEPAGGKLRLQYVDHTGSHIFGELEWHKDIIHGKNGWKRIAPEVEDDSVEKIEFDNVNWDISDCFQKRPMPFVGDEKHKSWGDIRGVVAGRPKMKMILEMPKNCSHGKGLNDYCEPCGRTHGG